MTAWLSPTILNSAPGRATRLDMVNASQRARDFADAAAKEHSAEAFEPADDLVRALKRFHALTTNSPDKMEAWLYDTAGGALDQLSNVEAAIDSDLDEQGASPVEPLDLSELRAFWESVK